MHRLALVTLVSLVLAGCDSVPPTAPPAGPTEPSYAISDGAHNGGNPRFYFLPPMVSSTSYTGVFDATASPVVEICALATPTTCSSGAPVATYSMTTGTGGELIKVDPINQHYAVKWRTKDFNLSTSIVYRIIVRLDATELGYADVQIVASNPEMRNVNTNEFIPLVDDRLLNILFRIEQGAAGPRAITIDATALSVETIALDGFSTFPTATAQSFTLGAGSYKLYYNAGVSQPNVNFTVTNGGTLDYDPALDAVLTGRGTTTLHVNGRTIQLDATRLSVSYVEINSIFGGATALPSSVVKTMTLLPAVHQFFYNAGVSQPGVLFTLTNAGTVDYDAALDGVLDGRGTSTLRVNGRTIQLDATRLSVSYVEINSIFGGATALPSSVVKTMTLLPAVHQFFYNAGVSQPSVIFTVTSTGTIDYVPSLDAVLAGRGTTSLRVNGRTIQVNASGVATFELFGGGTFPATSSLTLLADLHEIRAGTHDFNFGIAGDGTVSYDAALYPFLTGAGSTVLGIQ